MQGAWPPRRMTLCSEVHGHSRARAWAVPRAGARASKGLELVGKTHSERRGWPVGPGSWEWGRASKGREERLP